MKKTHIINIIEHINQLQAQVNDAKKEIANCLKQCDQLEEEANNSTNLSSTKELIDNYKKLEESRAILLNDYKLNESQNIKIINLLQIFLIHNKSILVENEYHYFDILGVSSEKHN